MKREFKPLNEYEFTSDTCIGYTTKGEIFVVDLDKYDLIKDYTWHINKQGYVVSNSHGNNTLRLHRLVTDCPKELVVDHINGSKSRHDNRMSNLRVCTASDNNKNSISRNSLGIKGVSYVGFRNKFQAQICVDKKFKFLGSFDDVLDASNAYDKAAIKYFGEYALLNKMQGASRPKTEVLKRKRFLSSLKVTVTYCNTGETYRYTKHLAECSVCGNPCSPTTHKCLDCYNRERNICFNEAHDNISREELKQLIRTTPFLTIGKIYNVSDNAIRKWCIKFNLPFKSSEIKRYSDEEWEAV